MPNPCQSGSKFTVYRAISLPNPLCVSFPTPKANPTTPLIRLPCFFFPMLRQSLSEMYLHSGALCNISPGHLFCLLNCTAPVSPESIPPPCGRQLIPVPAATRAQDFITHTGQGRYLCSLSLCSIPLKPGGLSRYWQVRVLSPGEELQNPLTFKFSPPFYLGFLISSTED